MRDESGPVDVFAGRYEVERPIGNGNRTRVDRAVDRLTGETVALKRWSGTLSGEARAAFEGEARAVARLGAPGLVGYRSYGFVVGSPFLAMELVPGGTLAGRLARLDGDGAARAPLPLREALDLCKRVALTLAQLHAAGLAHGNVGPRSVLLPTGATWTPKLGDRALETTELVRAGFAEGWFEAHVGFWSPQLFRAGGAATPRDDVYSMGALLFRCVAGCMPFTEHDRPTRATALPASPAPRRLRDLAPNLPPDLLDLVDRMLSNDPAGRPRDALEPCRALYDLARRLGSYDTLSEAELTPAPCAIPLHFEARDDVSVPAPRREPVEPRVDPEALRGPFVILDRPIDAPLDAGFGAGLGAGSSHDLPLSPGDSFAGRFTIEEVLPAGRAGTVYRAKDVESRDAVALRIFDGAPTPRELRQFLATSATHAQRYHPRIVRVLHRGLWRGRMFLAMDWISGETLAQRLAREALTTAEAVTVIRGLLEGLELVHTMGLVQGNLSPRNVFLRNRNVEWSKLGDVAIWREPASHDLARAPALPRAPGPTGSPRASTDDLAYVAPEVARFGKPSARGDVYTLGVIAYRLLAGVLPVEPPPRDALAFAPRARPLAEHRPDAPASLCRLVDGLLEPDPARRPQDATVAAAYLSRPAHLGWSADLGPGDLAPAAPGAPPATRPARKRLDPLTDERFQDYLADELARRAFDEPTRRRLRDVAHGACDAAQSSPGCALCGGGPSLERHFLEVRRDVYTPLEPEDLARARPPLVCSICLATPFEPVHAAARTTLQSFEGDDDQPVAIAGPTRREVRDAISLMVARAVPRMGTGRCIACESTRDAVVGRDAAMCPACLSAAARVHARWVDEAPVRKARRARRRLDDTFRVALEVTGRPARDPREAVYPTRPEGPPGVSWLLEVVRLRTLTPPTQREIDALANAFADAIFADVANALTDEGRPGSPPESHGYWVLPRYLEELQKRYQPRGAAAERLRLALAVKAEAERRGARLYDPGEGIETIGG